VETFFSSCSVAAVSTSDPIAQKSSSREVYEVKMKPPRYAQGQFSQNIPELIQQLRNLSAGMEADPTLAEPAKHLRRAVDELETVRQAAFEVYQECIGARARTRTKRSPQRDESEADDAAEWLRDLEPASPLKQ
jgi:hypothetical protein